ncbi:serine/threonine dehydratase [Aureimonas sp. SA4125]|uniref:threonine ammonia-lyase n=1 Tax=Aureimonas sp. SA4125 TaxID=2826993 RepID=UPI001CC82BC4|nr:pyridoxal-phosphate dependent enzyme [Aureimonas sp. SA4125]BDA86999.1 serine/threonine dehydratase [Aureimonas sp. SA4125]
MNPIITATAADAVQARSRIRPFIYQTPLLPSRERGGEELAFKAENFQITGSFKIRGAAAKMTAVDPGQALITASSGNHGIGAAMAASSIGQSLTVVLPRSVSPGKLARIRSFAVEVVLHGDEAGEAERHAQELARARGLVYVSPYNDRDIIAGQGTIALELLEQAERIDNVFVSMGGGGLISGIGSVLKAFSPRTRVIGVSAAASMALAASMEAGRIVETEHRDTIADGVAGGLDEDSMTLPLAMAVIDEVVVCDEDAIVAEIASIALNERQVVEGAAALAMAGYRSLAHRLAGQRSVVVLCGSNFAPDRIMPLIRADA